MRGFSLIEILVSLLVVSLASFSIVGVQKIIGHQGRDNFVHGTVLKMSIEKMNNVLQFQSLMDVEALEGAVETITEPQTQTEFIVAWRVTEPEFTYAAGDNVRDIAIQISWDDSYGKRQDYRYHEQINLRHLMALTAGNNSAPIIEPVLASTNYRFFDEKETYHVGAFVIYNSELFEATSVHFAGETVPRDIVDPSVVSEGWKSYGVVSNPALASNPDLVALF